MKLTLGARPQQGLCWLPVALAGWKIEISIVMVCWEVMALFAVGKLLSLGQKFINNLFPIPHLHPFKASVWQFIIVSCPLIGLSNLLWAMYCSA